MSPSVAESSTAALLAAFALLLLLVLVLSVAPVAAQEHTADAANTTQTAKDVPAAGDEATGNPPETDAAAAGEPAEATAGDGWHLAVGIALGTFVIPVESDLTAESLAPELYLDVDIAPWLGLRLGINSVEMKLDELTLQTRSVYLAYRHAFPVTAGWWGEAFAGVATAESVLSGGRTELTATGSGHMLGVAGWRRLGSFDLGLRYQLLFTDSDFSGISLNTGSNQVQLTAAYRWF